eukprot:gnl/Chilomastix_cuspidata/4193.p1 GENE.gnl/Chilomastix_cuspidata/4193~~gnl/Chilomastix_cuspidata/4193.p1  ORF type:complete len:1126 (-),score=192.83 gnl/Chilomastix_cuspidata/4193:407-3571(-)
MRVFNPVIPDSCDHLFCRQCFENWIQSSQTCPICRSFSRGFRQAPLEISNKASFCVCPNPNCQFTSSFSEMVRHLKLCKFCCPSCGEELEGPEAPLHNAVCWPQTISICGFDVNPATDALALAQGILAGLGGAAHWRFSDETAIEWIACLSFLPAALRADAASQVVKNTGKLLFGRQNLHIIDEEGDLFPFFLSSLASLPFPRPLEVRFRLSRPEAEKGGHLPGLLLRTLARMHIRHVHFRHVSPSEDREAERLFIESLAARVNAAPRGAAAPPPLVFDCLGAVYTGSRLAMPFSDAAYMAFLRETLLRNPQANVLLRGDRCVARLQRAFARTRAARAGWDEFGFGVRCRDMLRLDYATPTNLFFLIFHGFAETRPQSFEHLRLLVALNVELSFNRIEDGRFLRCLRALPSLTSLSLDFVALDESDARVPGFLCRLLKAVPGGLEAIALPLTAAAGYAPVLELMVRRLRRLHFLGFFRGREDIGVLAPLVPFIQARIAQDMRDPVALARFFAAWKRGHRTRRGLFALEFVDQRITANAQVELSLAMVGASFPPLRDPLSGCPIEPLHVEGPPNWGPCVRLLRREGSVLPHVPCHFGSCAAPWALRLCPFSRRVLRRRHAPPRAAQSGVPHNYHILLEYLEAVMWDRIEFLELSVSLHPHRLVALGPRPMSMWDALLMAEFVLKRVRRRGRHPVDDLGASARRLLRALEETGIFDLSKPPCLYLRNLGLVRRVLAPRCPVRVLGAHAVHLRRMVSPPNAPVSCGPSPAPRGGRGAAPNLMNSLPHLSKISFSQHRPLGQILISGAHSPPALMYFLCGVARTLVIFLAQGPPEPIARGGQARARRHTGPTGVPPSRLRSLCRGAASAEPRAAVQESAEPLAPLDVQFEEPFFEGRRRRLLDALKRFQAKEPCGGGAPFKHASPNAFPHFSGQFRFYQLLARHGGGARLLEGRRAGCSALARFITSKGIYASLAAPPPHPALACAQGKATIIRRSAPSGLSEFVVPFLLGGEAEPCSALLLLVRRRGPPARAFAGRNGPPAHLEDLSTRDEVLGPRR